MRILRISRPWRHQPVHERRPHEFEAVGDADQREEADGADIDARPGHPVLQGIAAQRQRQAAGKSHAEHGEYAALQVGRDDLDNPPEPGRANARYVNHGSAGLPRYRDSAAEISADSANPSKAKAPAAHPASAGPAGAMRYHQLGDRGSALVTVGCHTHHAGAWPASVTTPAGRRNPWHKPLPAINAVLAIYLGSTVGD